MNISETGFAGLFVLETINFQDERGGFQKLFNFDFFQEQGLETEFKEFYYSVNKKNVIRGMHFQNPPYDHTKLVYVSRGKIRDVALDLRKNQPTYGHSFSIELDAKTGYYVYIPKGFAHGFVCLEEGSIVNYAQTSCYSKTHDSGIGAMSFGFEWRVENPIRSGRDLSFRPFVEFDTPF